MESRGFPTAKDVAKQFLLYKLGEAFKNNNGYRGIRALNPKGDGVPVTLLKHDDLEVLKSLGFEWSEKPKPSGITELLEDEASRMQTARIELKCSYVEAGWGWQIAPWSIIFMPV